MALYAVYCDHGKDTALLFNRLEGKPIVHLPFSVYEQHSEEQERKNGACSLDSSDKACNKRKIK